MAAYAAHTTTKILKTKQEPHKRTYLSENGGLGEKKSAEANGPKAEKDKTERATGIGIRTKEGIEQWDQTENPEILDRGKTSEVPGLPSGLV